MANHMKTTIDIPNSLFQEAKKIAHERGSTLKEILQVALHSFLRQAKSPAKSFRLRKHAFRGHGLVKGLSEGDWGEIRRRIYEGRGG